MLNPQLYEALLCLSKVPYPLGLAPTDVDVMEENQPLVRRDAWEDGRVVRKVDDWGEHYRLCCPFCKDHKPRMHVNHAFMFYSDPWEVGIKCFNDECVKGTTPGGRENRQAFRDMLAAAWTLPSYGEVDLEPARPVRKALEPVPAPQVFALRQHKLGREYVESRGYSAETLEAEQGLGVMPGFYPRLYVPMHHAGNLVGWQTRKLVAEDDMPKWMTSRGFKKNQTLFGFDDAATSGTDFMVVVEGVFDRYGVGTPAGRGHRGCPAVATLGKSMSYPQAKMLAAWAAEGSGRRVFVMYDRDLKDGVNITATDTAEAVSLLKSEGVEAFPIFLTEGKDPGEYDHAALWRELDAARGA